LAVIKFDPGMAFGTGKHETTKACLQYIDECAVVGGSFLDMGCGSGILSIAAAKLGYGPVAGFDVDQEAVDASVENAAKNRVDAEFFKYGLGGKVKKELPKADLVAANILGPLLIRFADEIVESVKSRIIISGILNELYPEVLAAYEARGFKELSRKTIGEWTTGLLTRQV
jgi:ribosomal protein L11 methyltransferase